MAIEYGAQTEKIVCGSATELDDLTVGTFQITFLGWIFVRGKWTFVGVTVDGGEQKIFEGDLTAVVTEVVDLPDEFGGVIGRSRVWHRILSPNEIRARQFRLWKEEEEGEG